MNMRQQAPPIVSAAQSYAARGWHVFPVPPGEKKSYKAAEHSGGRKWGATTDPTEIRQDWLKHPEANVGIVTGPKSGFFVVEADTMDGHDVDGLASLAALEAKHGSLPDTIEAESPSGSRHFYFRWPKGFEIKNSASQVAPGIDVRGDGGMVVGVPSRKPGKDRPYVWVNPPPLFELADCPDWLLQLCLKPVVKTRAKANSVDFDGTTKWAETALASEIAQVLSASSGSRNQTLNRAAFALGQIVAGGGLDEEFVRARLLNAALGIGLAQVEAEGTIESGFSAGLREPRQPKERERAKRRPRYEEETAAPVDPEDGEPDLSHDALANDLGTRSWNRNAKHIFPWGQWLFWDGNRWCQDRSLEHMTRVRAYLNTRACELMSWAARRADGLVEKDATKLLGWAKMEIRALRNAPNVSAVVNLARSNQASAAAPQDFDGELLLIGTPRGTVDLRTGEMRPARRADMITRLTAVAPQKGKPVQWLAFLDEIFDGDQEVIAFLQRAAGYALTGETSEHKLLFCYGMGRNGKSVFLNTLFYILGDYARRAHATTFLNTLGEKHPTDLAGLQGARLVVASELPKGKTWDESAIKDLTGGDVITARFMRGDFFDYLPQFTLMIAGNTMPSFKGVDEALRARVVLVPFTVTIPPEKRDRRLTYKLQEEAGQILSWAIEGALQWQEIGLAVPERVAAASKDYLDGEDILGQFLDEATVKDPMAFERTSDLHQRFSQWAARQGLQGWTMMTLQKALRERGLQVAQRNTGNGFLGLRLH